jgi:glucan phosphoethanolaminetransferase (alkaline phosphatase superfamily)
VLYTDWFIGQVLDQVRPLAVPVTVTFVADHGEDLLPLDGIAGHGTADYTRHQFEIPAFVWTNAAYRQAHPDRVEAMKAHVDQEIRSYNFFDSLGDLMGIRWPEAVPAESFVSPQFVPDTRTPHLAASKLVRRPE